MKNLLLALLFILSIHTVSQAQNNSPVFFPSGIVVGSSPGALNTPTGYKLYVADGILCEKVRVAAKSGNNWADYVFSPDYKLRSLKEVNSYIKQNSHLPDVPSADEINKNGIDIAENQATLLRKIEELTLYMIEQQNKIEKLQKEVKRLKKR
ncbi:hypothetical protein [Flectobacillus major]|uniref:hypothetical protein n=1 Tax=Flectobacillus major TaxID=103 RepID=UPI000694677B|nr:hypothetical protein [Flectobacillus major]